MLRTIFVTAAVAILISFASAAKANDTFADFVDETRFVTLFGTGVLTGPPDGGGAFLSDTLDPPTNLGFITVGFTGGLINGTGNDITIHEVGTPVSDESANVFVSNDGINFTFIGLHTNGDSSFDWDGLFADTVYFVKIDNTSMVNSADIDAFQGHFSVPEPSSLTVAFGIAVASVVRRRRYA